MRTTPLRIGLALGLAVTAAAASAQTPNTGSSGDVYASDGGGSARWWKEKAKQYPLCAAPANEGATLTGQIVEEAYKKPEDIDKVNELGAQREQVKHELQTCIAQNYSPLTLKGGVTENTQGDPGDDGSYGGGSGTPGTPGTGKTPPAKNRPPLSGGTSKGGGSGSGPGHSTTPPANIGHGNSGPHNTPPLYTGTVTLTWKETGHRQPGNVPYRKDGTDKITLKIWDMTDPNIPLDNKGSLKSVNGTFSNGVFTISTLEWRSTNATRQDVTLSPSSRVRLTKHR